MRGENRKRYKTFQFMKDSSTKAVLRRLDMVYDKGKCIHDAK